MLPHSTDMAYVEHHRSKHYVSCFVPQLPIGVRKAGSCRAVSNSAASHILGRCPEVDARFHTTERPLGSKNGTPRGVPVNGDAIAVLEGERGKHPCFCFTYRGDPIGWDVANTAWQTALRKAGIDDFGFHDLRHTWASWHRQGGQEVRRAQRSGRLEESIHGGSLREIRHRQSGGRSRAHRLNTRGERDKVGTFFVTAARRKGSAK